jgi:hypothetical protein
MITTDDGSYCEKGFVTDKLRQLIESGTPSISCSRLAPFP